jgi:hypothetical protein
MLATQLDDGDLRLWSIEKHPGMNQKGARVIRILDRLEKRLSGRKWMGWSKNGRIIEYSEGYVFFKHPIPVNKAYKQFPIQQDHFMGYKNEKSDQGRYSNLEWS